MRPVPEIARAGQESVWAFARPAIAQPCARHLTIVHGGITVADTHAAVRTIETSHPPTYYFPPQDVIGALVPDRAKGSLCEWKGQATYFDVVVGDVTLRAAAWSYARPTPAFAAIAGHIAFYPAAFDRCTVDGETAIPQPGGFYGGWITRDLAGPFKGGPGSRFW